MQKTPLASGRQSISIGSAILLVLVTCLSVDARAAPPSAASAPRQSPPPAVAAPPPVITAAPPAVQPPSKSVPAPAEDIAGGFRSARFGMSEAEVRQAIAHDFATKPEDIRADANPAELTRALTVVVPDLIDGGGKASVAYVFGYKTQKLIQVGITWSSAIDDTVKPDRLFINANILREHFLAGGYRPDSITTNAPIAGGLLMFRGSDAKGHTTALLLQGTFRSGENNQRVLTPTGLLLYYVVDPKDPDVFKLPAGSF